MSEKFLIVIAAIGILVGVMVIAMYLTGIVTLDPNDEEYDDAEEIDYDDNEYPDDDGYPDDDEYTHDYREPEEAVDVNERYLSTDEYDDMILRVNYPRLYSDDWYENCRKDLSHWVVQQYEERRRWRLEMGLAA